MLVHYSIFLTDHKLVPLQQSLVRFFHVSSLGCGLKIDLMILRLTDCMVQDKHPGYYAAKPSVLQMGFGHMLPKNGRNKKQNQKKSQGCRDKKSEII